MSEGSPEHTSGRMDARGSTRVGALLEEVDRGARKRWCAMCATEPSPEGAAVTPALHDGAMRASGDPGGGDGELFGTVPLQSNAAESSKRTGRHRVASY